MWVCERRNWGLSDREIQLGAKVSSGSLVSRFEAVQDILRQDPKNRTMLEQISRCGDGQPCQKKYCERCYGRPLDPKKWKVDQNKFIDEEVLNPVYYNDRVGCGAYRHIQKIQNFLKPFYGIPIDGIVPFTLKFCYFQGGEDYAATTDWYSNWMRVIGKEFCRIVNPDAKFSYRFEWSFTTVQDAVWDLPLRAPGVADLNTMDPDQVVALLHCHGIAHFPGFTHREAGQFFRMVFDGPSQVHVSTPRPDQVAMTYGSWPSMIELEEAMSSKLIATQLPDHPDDAVFPYEVNEGHSAYEAPKDELWDAMVDELFGDDELCEDEDGVSGIAGFVNYACKEHLPKSESRYQKLAEAKQANPTSEASSATKSSSHHKELSPEQMVVAVHADAELKRAFHNIRLTRSFGTRGKPKSTNRKADMNTAKPSPSTQKTISNNRPRSASDPTQTFDAATCAKPETAIHCEIDRSGEELRHTPQFQTTISSNKEGPTYKEVDPPRLRKPLFAWVLSLWRFTLCLGLRVLRPP